MKVDGIKVKQWIPGSVKYFNILMPNMVRYYVGDGFVEFRRIPVGRTGMTGKGADNYRTEVNVNVADAIWTEMKKLAIEERTKNDHDADKLKMADDFEEIEMGLMQLVYGPSSDRK